MLSHVVITIQLSQLVAKKKVERKVTSYNWASAKKDLGGEPSKLGMKLQKQSCISVYHVQQLFRVAS